jgi:hypothetical protein
VLVPNGIIKICGDRTTGVSTLEKLQALATAYGAAAGPRAHDLVPLSSCQRSSASAPRVQPLDNEGIPMNTIQVSTDAA